MSVAAADEGVYRTSLTLATKSAPTGPGRAFRAG